jgi:hypothetical protein
VTKYIVPMGVTFEAGDERAAQAMARELAALIADAGVKFALQGAGVRAGVAKVAPVVGAAQVDTR